MHPYEFSVSLRFSGVDFDPELIPASLGLEPTSKHSKGQTRTTPTEKSLKGVHETNYCSFLLCKKRSGDLNTFLSGELDKLEKHSKYFEAHIASENKIEFFIGWYGAGNIGEVFSYLLLRRMGGLGIDMALDIYVS
ncbi:MULTISPECIES: DUF4279 domain-containing protein [Pseudomonas]|uniref:DUF4279 domain-containing protein n=1 Tax=Pseudomonas TaxID=286 RepID=UPI000CD4BB45|nr:MULTISPECIES: DUF4279 domain-containing protein [Pseudomonas]RBH52316.1 DUF4279 domain-containing protein [Pseudomonas sp. MWU13-2860]